MNETQTENQKKIENQIEVRKKVLLFLHNDGFKGEDLEPLLLIDNEKIYTIMIKKKYPYDMYYFFDMKKYLKMWLDKRSNLLIYFNNWSGDLFVNQKQSVEYIDRFSYIAGESELICNNIDGTRKKLILEGFDILSLTINQFSKYEEAIFYILCYKLS